MRSGDRLTNSYTIVFCQLLKYGINVVKSFRDNKSAVKNISDFDRTFVSKDDYSK